MDLHRKRILKKLIYCLIYLLSLFPACAEPLQIITNKSILDFDVEIAKTEKELEKGLMFRTSLDHRRGMLFIFPESHSPKIWMKNTLIYLDVLFISQKGVIQDITPSAKPLSFEIIQSKKHSPRVLELKGGTCRKLGIFPGHRVRHPAFKKADFKATPQNNSK